MTDVIAPASICPVMLGRDEPIRAIRTLLEQATDGVGQVALISGEAGIGKSRLVRALREAAQISGASIAQGTCFETDQMLPYAPVIDLVRASLPLLAPDQQGRFALSPELVRLLPELAGPTADLPPADADDPSLDGEQRRRRLHQTLADLLTRLTVDRTTLIILEDIHWCDDATLDFLRFFVRSVPAHRLILVLTCREEAPGPAVTQFLASLSRERLATEIRLRPLAAEAVRAMINAMFGASPVNASRSKLDQTIWTMSEGNPFLVEEIVKSLVAAGDLYASDGQWKAKPLLEVHIPRTIQVNLSQRLERLSPEARDVLSMASVAGRRFDFDVLQHLAGLSERGLLQIIRELRDAQLVIEESADQVAFRHALTQQAVYNDLLLRERRSRHALMGEALERRYGETPAHAGEIAYQYARAERWERAAVFARRAAEWAQKLFAPGTAIEHYTSALEALDHLGQPPPPDLLRARAQMHERTGNFEAAREDYARLVALAQAAGDRAAEWQAWSDLGWLWTERDFARAGEYFEHVLSLAPQMTASPALVQMLNRVGNWHLHADQLDQGLHYHQQALALAEQAGEWRSIADSLDLLGLTCFYLGRMDRGTASYARCTALFREHGEWAGLSGSLAVMAMRGASYNLDTFVCRPLSLADCIREGEEAVAAARRIGWRAGEASALLYCGFALGPRGEFDQALSATHLGLQVAQAIDHVQWQGAAHLVLGAVYRDLLAWPEAIEHHESVLGITEILNAPLLRRMVSGHLASTYIAGGVLDRAQALLDAELPPDLPMQSVGQRLLWAARAELALAADDPATALDIMDRLITAGAPVDEDGAGTADSDRAGETAAPRLDYLKGEALRQLGERAAAERTLRVADAAAREQGALPLRWQILVSLGRCLRAKGRHEQAHDAFAAAGQVIDDLAGRIGDPALRDRFHTAAYAHITSHHRPSPQRAAKRAFDGLTEREREIAVLIAAGKSNRGIADALTLSERTVAKHVENILSKLGYTSRAQVAAWAVERGLHAPPRE